MIQTIRTLASRALLYGAALMFGAFTLAPAAVSAVTADPTSTASTTQSEVCDAIGSGPGCTGNRGGNLSPLVKFIVNVITIIAGVLAVIMIIIAGMKYITSGGDSNKIASAKNALLYAIIGLVVVALAQLIVRFVLSKAASAA